MAVKLETEIIMYDLKSSNECAMNPGRHVYLFRSVPPGPDRIPQLLGNVRTQLPCANDRRTNEQRSVSTALVYLSIHCNLKLNDMVKNQTPLPYNERPSLTVTPSPLLTFPQPPCHPQSTVDIVEEVGKRIKWNNGRGRYGTSAKD